MEKTVDDWSALYPEFKTVTIGGIEMRLSHRIRLPDLPPMTADEIRGHSGPPSPPRPTVTAWEGADIDAYYFADDDLWHHCQTEAVWPGHDLQSAA